MALFRRKRRSIVDDVTAAAEQIAVALTRSGYAADFSAQSLLEIDRFFDEQSSDGQAVPDGLLSKQLGARLFALGAYTGEVIRRHREGEWIGDDDDPEAEFTVQVRLADGTLIWPVQRVMKRFTNGREDGIAAYAAALDVDAGEQFT